MDAESAARFLLGLGALLAGARAGGAVARRTGAPPVVGEILAGVLLGPTLLGHVAPAAEEWLFPATGPVAVSLGGFRLVALTLLVFMAGLEIDLGALKKLARPAFVTALGSLLVPFALGGALAWGAPAFFEAPVAVPRGAFAVFFGTALAISALPVLARILMDLGLLESELGVLALTAAMLDDLVGWLALSLVLAWINPGAHASPLVVLGETAGFAVVVFLVVRPILDRAPPTQLAPLLVLALVGGALTELIGTHAAIGAFLVGVAIRTEHLPKEVRASVQQFVTDFFSPVLFAGIGLRLDYLAELSVPLVLIVTVAACAAKLAGAAGGALLAGYSRRFAFAVAAALNARGAMEIVLAEIALANGVIGRRLFVALVVMALLTSLASGPLLVWRGERPVRPSC